MRHLERSGARFGRSDDPRDEAARLGQTLRVGFAVSDIESFRPARMGRPARLEINAFGLFGPEGPMPLHLTWWMQRRRWDRWYDEESGEEVADTTFLDFCNLLQHRMISLYYRAWADTRPEIDMEHGGTGQMGAILRALAGQQLPGSRPSDPAVAELFLSQAPTVAMQAAWPEKLVLVIGELLGTSVKIAEFAGRWIDLPARIQSRLARDPGTRLGADTVLGRRVFSRQNTIEITVGPMTLADYRALLPGKARFSQLRRVLGLLLGGGLDTDVRLRLRGDEVPAARLGQVSLSRDGWIGGRRGLDAQDLCLRNVWASAMGEA